jgi:SP family general alpha glucoside:H+ symporter-like MFS transporter
LVTAYFFLPEMKGLSYREIDIKFKRKIPARKWKETQLDVEDDEYMGGVVRKTWSSRM